MATHRLKPTVHADHSDFDAALERVRADILAFPASEVVHINVDIPHAATTVLAAVSAFAPFRDLFIRMPGFDTKRYDRLRDYALAAMGCHAARRPEPQTESNVAVCAQEGSALRTALVQDSQILALRHLINSADLAEVKQGAGYETLIVDLLRLARLLREAWPRIEGKTAISPAEIERAEELASQLTYELSARQSAPPVASEDALMRQKAFALMVTTYGEARAALGYLRRNEGDADSIAPSLYANRAKGRKKAASNPGADPQPPTASDDDEKPGNGNVSA